MVKDIMNRIRSGELEIGIYTSTNEKKENVVILCLNENHIITYTIQKNGWTRMNEYDENGNMIGESYDK